MSWRSLFHRWFVQYNPLYLVSAMLVLGGALLCSRGLTGAEGAAAPIGIALVTEVYAAALIGGAALLARLGLRRPAVMLGLLVALYQWDLTLHTETCLYLGDAGTAAALGWLAIFGLKIAGIGWALQIRFSKRFLAALALGAVGLLVGPRLLHALSQRAFVTALGVWAFGLGALYEEKGIGARFDLDAWGEVVLRRSTRAVSILAATLLGMHVAFWSGTPRFLVVLPVVVVLHLARRAKHEAPVWILASGTLASVLLVDPGSLSMTALLAASAFALRIVDPPKTEREQPVHRMPTYRGGARHTEATVVVESIEITAAERARLELATFMSTFLAACTVGFEGHGLPAPSLAIGVTYLAVLAILTFRQRRALHTIVALLPFGPAAVRVMPRPHSFLAWGVTALVSGFVLLAFALGATWWLRRAAAPDDEPLR